ncbi:MAG: hypothetical protein ABIE84_00935 [bacterium]
MVDNKNNLEILEQELKRFWKKYGSAQIIAAKHTEFMVEPRIFMGDKLNPTVLEVIVNKYLACASQQDSGHGTVVATPEKLAIVTKKGKPMIVVRDKKIIQQYLAQQA